MKWMIIIYFLLPTIFVRGQIFTSTNNLVSFVSDAPLELISAQSVDLQGVLHLDNKAFAFQVNIQSFEGFNSPLQQLHFYENYLETEQFPRAFFMGKLIEDINVATRKYRAKGILEIHGIRREVILPVDLRFYDEKVQFTSSFEVKLADYDIEIPRIVQQKIAEIIKIETSGILIQKE